MSVPKLRFPEFLDAGEWEEGKLGGISVFIKERMPFEQLTLANYVSTENILPDFFGVTTASKLPPSGAATRFKKYDILISNIRPYLKKIWFASKDGGASNDVVVIRSKTKVSNTYLAFLLKSDEFINYVMKGAKGVKMPRGDISLMKEYPLALPLLPEQQKIADCLNSLDELIAAQSKKIESLKIHKKGLMQQLFPAEGETVPKLRFPEFCDVWKEKSIQDLIDEKVIIGHLDGNHGALYPNAEEFSQEGIPYISANDFVTGFIDFGKCKRLPTQRAMQFKKGVAKNGDILFAHNATVGPVVKLCTNLQFVILSTTATYFRCNTKYLINDFLKFALSSPLFVKQYTRVMSQSTRNQIPITTQRKFNLQLPTFAEQQKIADCLTSIDDLITAQTQKLAALKTHKKGLMQQLFPVTDEETE